MRKILFVLVAALLLAACTDGEPTVPDVPQLQLTIIGDAHREGFVGEELSAPVTVLVEEMRGNSYKPARGVTVNFVVTEGGGRVWAGTGVSDKDGLASDYWILGPEAGMNRLEVRAVSGDGTKNTYGEFTATGEVPNSPPVVGLVEFESPPFEGFGASCFARDFSDSDGDPLTYEWEWYVNGSLVQSSTDAEDTSSLPGSNLGADDVVSCTARAYDGEDHSDWAESEAVATGLPASASLAGGYGHTCALDAGGKAFCWGYNYYGQLGIGTKVGHHVPQAVGGTETFLVLTAGTRHTCGLAETGQAFCWGSNSFGQLGVGSGGDHVYPTPVVNAPKFVAIEAGGEHTCALDANGLAYCWGRGNYGQLGHGTFSNRGTPAPVGGGHQYLALAAGGNHTCGLGQSGQAACWGANQEGQVGDRTFTSRPLPTAVWGGQVFESIAAGFYHTCALDESGAPYCWGSNYYGQLGVAGAPDLPTPYLVPGSFTFQALDLGNSHSCGMDGTGATHCWGYNFHGELGIGVLSSPQYSPTPVDGGLTFQAMIAGGSNSCGVTAAGPLYCWGWNRFGAVGDGTTSFRISPTQVLNWPPS